MFVTRGFSASAFFVGSSAQTAGIAVHGLNLLMGTQWSVSRIVQVATRSVVASCCNLSGLDGHQEAANR